MLLSCFVVLRRNTTLSRLLCKVCCVVTISNVVEVAFDTVQYSVLVLASRDSTLGSSEFLSIANAQLQLKHGKSCDEVRFLRYVYVSRGTFFKDAVPNNHNGTWRR